VAVGIEEVAAVHERMAFNGIDVGDAAVVASGLVRGIDVKPRAV
jgi:hypothetical protein